MCNVDLIGDLLSGAENANFGFIAHIVAAAPDGPRGDETLSRVLADDPDNLMLLCHVHHKAVDVDKVDEYPVERLRAIKERHERRVAIQTGMLPDRESHVVRYAANVGQHHQMMPYQDVARALLPDRFPADGRDTIDLSLRGSTVEDDEDEFWRMESNNLRRQFATKVRDRIEAGDVHHLSIFAIAPQPLLVLLGALLGDLTPSDVYQRHREPVGWTWPADGAEMPIIVSEPPVGDGNGPVALKIALSATVDDSRIRAVLGEDTSIWSIITPGAHNDALKRRGDLVQFRRTLRRLLDRIKAVHPLARAIDVFPAMPVATAVETGRVWMPKADLPLMIWDENRKLGGFGRTISIG